MLFGFVALFGAADFALLPRSSSLTTVEGAAWISACLVLFVSWAMFQLTLLKGNVRDNGMMARIQDALWASIESAPVKAYVDIL